MSSMTYRGQKPEADLAVARAISTPWLFSSAADISIISIPIAFTSFVYLVAFFGGDASGVGSSAYAGWVTAFILGNTTHVILTFLLLRMKPDILHSTPKQARTADLLPFL